MLRAVQHTAPKHVRVIHLSVPIVREFSLVGSGIDSWEPTRDSLLPLRLYFLIGQSFDEATVANANLSQDQQPEILLQHKPSVPS